MPFEPCGFIPYHVDMLKNAPPIGPRLATLLILVTALFASAAFAQQPANPPASGEFKLTDEDVWKQAPGTVPDPETPEGQLMEARRALASGDFIRAERMSSQWIERNERHPLIADAYLIRGDSKVADDDEYEALFDYEYIARMFTGTEVFVTALDRELEIARQYAGGRYRKLWGLRFIPAYEEAEELFIRIQERMPGSRIAERAGMELADYYFEHREMTMAVDAYALFIENYPRSDQLPKARRRLIYSHLASFKGPEFDAAGLYEARSRLNALRFQQPFEAQQIGADGLVTRIDESDASKMLETARWYLRTGNPIAAELTIRRLVKRYDRTVATADALRLIPEVLPLLPERVVREAPDYSALRAGILGVQGEPPTNAPKPSPEPSVAPKEPAK